MTQCGLLNGPLPDCDDNNPNDRCTAGCAVMSNCTELTETFCSGIQNNFFNCAVACPAAAAPPAGTFYCNDGSYIPGSWVCDGEADCTGGEDEADCTNFTCNDGYIIPGRYVCDSFEDCTGGEDELNCGGSTIYCNDGSTIPATALCDGIVNCSGGEDEAECTPDGELICPGQ
jgi:hypothetical protein